MDIAMKNNLQDVATCCQIELEDLYKQPASQVIYTCVQSADVSFLEADICLLAMDQPQVNVLDDAKRVNKPRVLSYRTFPGLKEGQENLSKTDASSSIYMEDEECEVNRKIKSAFCPPMVVENNPCMGYIERFVFPWLNEFAVERKPQNGGDKTFKSFKEVTADYATGELHPGDLKPALAKAINRILQPVRDHFKNDQKAKNLLKTVKKYRTSRDRITTPMKDDDATLSKHMESFVISSDSESSQTRMSLDERFDRIWSIGEECIEKDDLRQKDNLRRLLQKKVQPVCYDGFEPSGRMHIAQGVVKAINVKKLTSSGCKMKIWIANWFAQLNDKMGGDLEKTQTVGKYFIEIWKALGMDTGDQVEFLWSSVEINSRAQEYWPRVLDIARTFTLRRIMKCCPIMGRTENHLSAAQIFYPCMQCTDIFFLKADICQLGMDQLKVNVRALEYCDAIKRKNKPIILSHHMLPGLKQGQLKMSKSDPSSSIYMEDEEDQVNKKIKEAFCPEMVVENNPCMEYVKYIVFPSFDEFTVARDQENGGNKTFKSFEELAADYESGKVQPSDLKPALSNAINRILQPVRDHFKNDQNAKDLLATVKSFSVTR